MSPDRQTVIYKGYAYVDADLMMTENFRDGPEFSGAEPDDEAVVRNAGLSQWQERWFRRKPFRLSDLS